MAQFGIVTTTPSLGSLPSSSPASLTTGKEEKKCYKLLTAEGKYHQKAVSRSRYALVLTDMTYTWICACMTKDESYDWGIEPIRTTLLPPPPLPPDVGPERLQPDPKLGNFWQERSFKMNVKIAPTDKKCDPIKSGGSPGTYDGGTTTDPPVSVRRDCFGGDDCTVDEERKELGQGCEEMPCEDDHTERTSTFGWTSPSSWVRELGILLFGCDCEDHVRAMIRAALGNIGTCFDCEPSDNRCCCESSGWENEESFECTVSGETQSV